MKSFFNKLCSTFWYCVNSCSFYSSIFWWFVHDFFFFLFIITYTSTNYTKLKEICIKLYKNMYKIIRTKKLYTHINYIHKILYTEKLYTQIWALWHLHPHYCAFYGAPPGYCTSLSHMSITHGDVFPFFSVINYVQSNSPNTVKFNFRRSDIVWCGKPNVNVVKK